MTKMTLDKIQTTHELLQGNTIITIKTKLFRSNAITAAVTELKHTESHMVDNWIYIRKYKYVCILIILKTEVAQVIDFFLVENHFTLLSQI